MTAYPAPTRARRVALGICPVCDGFVPVAASKGFTHELAGLLCLEHLLIALGMPLAHPQPATEAPDPSAVRTAFRDRLRTPGPRLEHLATPATRARQTSAVALEAETLAAALECMRQLGAVPLRSEPTYGVPIAYGCDWKPPTARSAPRAYDAGRPIAWAMLGVDEPCAVGPPGLPVDLEDEAVPSGARTLGRGALKAAWRVRCVVGPETAILSCERAGVLVMARYELGDVWRFKAGWLRGGRGEPVACAVKQVTLILKAGA